VSDKSFEVVQGAGRIAEVADPADGLEFGLDGC
jgi:hypothetical protein